MKKNSLLYILLAFLILVNGFFVLTHLRKPAKRFMGPEAFIVKELKFDDSQIKKFNELTREHHETLKDLGDTTRDLKENLLSSTTDGSIIEHEIDSIIDLLGEKQKEKEKAMYNNMKAIHDLCNEEQKQKFQHIIRDAMHRNGAHEGDRPPPPH